MLAVLAGLAPMVVIVRDRFNDNAINTNFWLELQDGGVTLAERNRRLEFTADGATGSSSHAMLEVRNWGARWSQDFEIEVDYRLAINSTNGDRDIVLGIVLAFAGDIPGSFTGYVGAIQREGDTLVLFLDRFKDGDTMQSDEVEIATTSGTLTVEYNRSSDRMEARSNGDSVHLNGVWSRFGEAFGNEPMVVAIGCATFDGNIAFPGGKVRLDNFQFTGVKKSR
jgi:hypothetical protein